MAAPCANQQPCCREAVARCGRAGPGRREISSEEEKNTPTADWGSTLPRSFRFGLHSKWLRGSVNKNCRGHVEVRRQPCVWKNSLQQSSGHCALGLVNKSLGALQIQFSCFAALGTSARTPRHQLGRLQAPQAPQIRGPGAHAHCAGRYGLLRRGSA